MQNTEPVFYFSLPRLVARWRGANDARTEANWPEAILAGIAVHAMAYVFAAYLFFGGLVVWQQVLLLAPLVIFVWLGWLALLYANSLIVKLLRGCGLLRLLPDNRAQSLLIGVMITGFACEFVRAGSWLGVIGGVWLALVFLNLAAAATLAVLHRNGSTAS